MRLLEVRDLQFTAPGASRPTVSVDRLVVEAGERIVVRGPSGSGKSSLLRCIVGLERADAGEVRWRGAPVPDAVYPAFRADCGYVQQKPVGTESTVGEDLAFARGLAVEHQRTDCLDEAAQRQRLQSLGLGELPWDRAYDRLSVGEQQRVALVRGLTLAPTLLLLDEPTSALDPERVAIVERVLLDYVAEQPDARAFLWVTHQPEQADRISTRVLELPGLQEASDDA